MTTVMPVFVVAGCEVQAAESERRLPAGRSAGILPAVLVVARLP
jgi:hypothetical protein